MSTTVANKIIQGVKAVNLFRDTLNPLRYLPMPRAIVMMEQAQRGMMPDLQWTYGAEVGIESTDADLMVIIERSIAAVVDAEWKVKRIEQKTRGFDAALANEQEAFLREHYEGCRNLREAWAHLALARFRGYAHVNPQYSAAGTLERLEPLDQWNFCRDGSHGDWYWNEKALQCDVRSLGEKNRLAPQDYVALTWRRSVNRIALIKYVRQTTAEKDWDFYVECYGLPGVFIIMPDHIPSGQEEEYRKSAEDAATAGSGALPHGADVKTPADGARATQPFHARLEWLQKQLVLAGTGGLLTVLSESGSGTLAGSVHEQAFRQIGRALGNRISEAFQEQFDVPNLREAFPGKPVLAYFELQMRQQKITAEIVKDLTALALWFELDPEEVSRETGYTIKAMKQIAAPSDSKASGGYGSFLARARCRSQVAPLTDEALRASSEELLAKAQASDFQPLASALQEALQAPDFAALQKNLTALRARLPAIAAALLTKPEAAAVMDQIMTAGLFNGLAEGKAGQIAMRRGSKSARSGARKRNT